MDLWLWFLFAILVLALGTSSDSKQSQQQPNPKSRSDNPHSADAREALRKADWRCQACGVIVSPVSSDPLHIEELPSYEYVGGDGRYSKFRILCTECHSRGPLFYRPPTAVGAASQSATPRKALSASLRRTVLARDHYTCRKCGARGGPGGTPGVQLHIDHIVPLSKGGTHDINNLQTLCAPCNTKKGQREWSLAKLLDAMQDRR